MLRGRIVFRSFRPGEERVLGGSGIFHGQHRVGSLQRPAGVRGLRQAGFSFGPDDNVVATPLPLQNSFYLGDITPPLTRGVTYYVSLRAVTVDGMKSDFSPPVEFSP